MKRRKMSKATVVQPTLPIRNPVATSPLLKKSRAHGKTRKAERRADKVSMRKMSFERVACLPATGSNDMNAYALLAA